MGKVTSETRRQSGDSHSFQGAQTSLPDEAGLHCFLWFARHHASTPFDSWEKLRLQAENRKTGRTSLHPLRWSFLLHHSTCLSPFGWTHVSGRVVHAPGTGRCMHVGGQMCMPMWKGVCVHKVVGLHDRGSCVFRTTQCSALFWALLT